MTSAFDTMAVNMWDLLGSVLVADQESFNMEADIQDRYANELRVYFFREVALPEEGDLNADLVLKDDRVELLDPLRTDRDCISGSVLYLEPAFHGVLAKFLGQKGITVPSSRIAELLDAPPDPPLEAARARYLLDRVLGEEDNSCRSGSPWPMG
jgi:hypothetical protein